MIASTYYRVLSTKQAGDEFVFFLKLDGIEEPGAEVVSVWTDDNYQMLIHACGHDHAIYNFNVAGLDYQVPDEADVYASIWNAADISASIWNPAGRGN